MNAPDPRAGRRRAMMVVRAMAAELYRQASEGALAHADKLDESGFINVAGSIDLARLALVTEAVMVREFW